MKKSPQTKLCQHLKAGRPDLAEKDVKAGATVFGDLDPNSLTGAEKELISKVRVELATAAIEAPSSASVKWLVGQDNNLVEVMSGAHSLVPNQDHVSGMPTGSWITLARSATADTLDWATENLFDTAPPFSHYLLCEMLSAALNRTDAVGLAWLARQGLTNDELWRNPERPMIWKVVNDHQTTWTFRPENLTARLEVLVPMGMTAESPASCTTPSALGHMLEIYAGWAGEGKASVTAAMERHLPRAFELLVQAGADPEAVDSTGSPLLRHIEGTTLGNWYVAQKRAERVHTKDLLVSATPRARRARP